VTVLIDTSVFIDYLRGHLGAGEVLENERSIAPLHASEITRLEILSGMKLRDEGMTRALFSTVIWHSVDAQVAEIAGELGRRWLPSYRSIDSADLAIAATAVQLDARLITCNVKHFPMFSPLNAPY